MFYDGAQVYKSKVSKFWPLLVGIENLPPHVRTRLCSGRFLTALFTSTQKTNSELFMLRDLFMEEIEFLKKGWEVEVKKITYFVIGVFSLQLMDAAALQEIMDIKLIKSYAPCFRCRCVKGTYPAVLGRIVHNNHRRLCHEMHFTRFYGQTRRNCPNGYFESNRMEKKMDPHGDFFKMLPVKPESAGYYDSRQYDFKKGKELVQKAWNKCGGDMDNIDEHLLPELRGLSTEIRKLRNRETAQRTGHASQTIQTLTRTMPGPNNRQGQGSNRSALVEASTSRKGHGNGSEGKVNANRNDRTCMAPQASTSKAKSVGNSSSKTQSLASKSLAAEIPSEDQENVNDSNHGKI